MQQIQQYPTIFRIDPRRNEVLLIHLNTFMNLEMNPQKPSSTIEKFSGLSANQKQEGQDQERQDKGQTKTPAKNNKSNKSNKSKSTKSRNADYLGQISRSNVNANAKNNAEAPDRTESGLAYPATENALLQKTTALRKLLSSFLAE